MRLFILSSIVISVVAFHVVPPAVSRHLTTLGAATADGGGLKGRLFGRFRKQRTVEQPNQIRVGDTIPDMDVEELVAQDDGSLETFTLSIQDVLGNNKAVLVGMPGAFTPVCTKEHLPGYIEGADKLKSLGIQKIAVMTTNDRYVNEEWRNAVGIEKDSIISMVSDGDGDLIKKMGLADDMGFGVGVRSKRFAMVTDNGKVTKLLMDDGGMNDCDAASAASLIQVLTPEGSQDNGDVDVTALGVGAAGVAALLAASQLLGGESTTATPQVPPPATNTVRMKKTPKQESSFSLINEFLNDK